MPSVKTHQSYAFCRMSRGYLGLCTPGWREWQVRPFARKFYVFIGDRILIVITGQTAYIGWKLFSKAKKVSFALASKLFFA